MYHDVEDLRIVQMAENLCDNIWEEVTKWNYFAKDTIGKQLVKAADSIAANVIEGEGRFHLKDNTHFLYISRGSLWECRYWLKRAFKRNLISGKKYSEFVDRLKNQAPQLNAFIKKKWPNRKNIPSNTLTP